MKFKYLKEKKIKEIQKEIEENLSEEQQSKLEKLAKSIATDPYYFPVYEKVVLNKDKTVDMKKLKVCIYMNTKGYWLKQNQNYQQPKKASCA